MTDHACIDGRDFLDLVERGSGLDWVARGLLLTSLAWPDSTAEERASLPVGLRDRLILALRVGTYGRELYLRARCRNCGTELEASLDLGALLAEHAAEPPALVSVEIEGERLEVRMPSSLDLQATSSLAPEEAEWALLKRCVPPERLSDAARLRPVIAEAVSEADPLSSVELELNCATCGGSFSEPFDIVDCFWSEIEAGARRAAMEVHSLASAYGWSERTILDMTPARRRLYLDLVAP